MRSAPIAEQWWRSAHRHHRRGYRCASWPGPDRRTVVGRHVDGYNRNRPSKLIDAEHETRDGLTNRVAGTGSSRGATRSSVSDAMRSRVDKADISRGPRSADTAAKVFLHWGAKILRAMDATFM